MNQLTHGGADDGLNAFTIGFEPFAIDTEDGIVLPSHINRDQFEQVRSILESARKKTKPKQVDLYDVFCGLLYVLKSGCQYPNGTSAGKKVRGIRRHIEVDSQGAVDGEQGGRGLHGQTFCPGSPRLLRAEVTVAKRSELHRFTVIPKRWVVERSFSWLGKCQYCGKTAKNA